MDCQLPPIGCPSHAFPTLVHDFLTRLPMSYAISGGEIRLTDPPRLLGRSLAPDIPIDLSRSGVPRDSLALTINPAPTGRFAPLDHLGKNTLGSPYELAVRCLIVPRGIEVAGPDETVLFRVIPLDTNRSSVLASATPEGQPVLSKILEQIGGLWTEAGPAIERWRLTAMFAPSRGRPKGSGVLANLEPAAFHEKFWELYAENKMADQNRALPTQGAMAAALKVDSEKTISRYCSARGLSWPPGSDYFRWVGEADKKSP